MSWSLEFKEAMYMSKFSAFGLEMGDVAVLGLEIGLF
jgi:hypothetical protein